MATVQYPVLGTKASGILLARVQHSQNINHIAANLIHHDVIGMHYMLAGAGHAPQTEKVGHARKALSRLHDGGAKIMRC